MLTDPARLTPASLPLPPQCCCYASGSGLVTYAPSPTTCTCLRVVNSKHIWTTVGLALVVIAISLLTQLYLGASLPISPFRWHQQARQLKKQQQQQQRRAGGSRVAPEGGSGGGGMPAGAVGYPPSASPQQLQPWHAASGGSVRRPPSAMDAL